MEPMFLDQPVRPDAEKLLSSLGNGSVLLARGVLEDPNFAATVVLICNYEKADGAYGLVLNRPSHMPLSEIFDGFTDMIGNREVFIGGPVQQEILQVVQITDVPQQESHQIAPRVYMGGKWEDLDSVLMLAPESMLLFLGYSGWAPLQLETEIQAGAWDVYRVDVEKLLMNSRKMLLTDVRNISSYLETLRIQPL
jgi:putative transcriptional regulator